MENLETNKSHPKLALSAKEVAIIAAILAISAGCGDDAEKCLGDRGEGKKDKVGNYVKDCDTAVDKYVSTTNADITRNPGIDSERFVDAVEACKLASKRSADLHKDVVDEGELIKREKKSLFMKLGLKDTRKQSCEKAASWAEARNEEANADAVRLRRK